MKCAGFLHVLETSGKGCIVRESKSVRRPERHVSVYGAAMRLPTFLRCTCCWLIHQHLWQRLLAAFWLILLLVCYTVWSAIGGILSSVRPSVCNAVHRGSQGQYTGLKVVPACFWQASSHLSLRTSFSHKTHRKKRIEENANVSFLRQTIRRALIVLRSSCCSLTSWTAELWSVTLSRYASV